jgi:hypothetical protein
LAETGNIRRLQPKKFGKCDSRPEIPAQALFGPPPTGSSLPRLSSIFCFKNYGRLLEPGFQEFATADLVCGGRVEIIFGRVALTDYLPIFFLDIKSYDALIIAKVHLFGELNEKDHVTGSGGFRPPLRKAEIAPRPAQAKLPVCIGAGSPDIVARAARLGFPQVPPMLGGTLSRFGGSRRSIARPGATAVGGPAPPAPRPSGAGLLRKRRRRRGGASIPLARPIRRRC